jgi:hypothetical protein
MSPQPPPLDCPAEKTLPILAEKSVAKRTNGTEPVRCCHGATAFRSNPLYYTEIIPDRYLIKVIGMIESNNEFFTIY